MVRAGTGGTLVTSAPARRTRRSPGSTIAGAAVASVLASACTPGPPSGPAVGGRPEAVGDTPVAALPPASGATPEDRPTGDGGALLHVANRGDGDSFVASDGVEYRVGLVNTPEAGDCGADEAADRAYELLADGFRAEGYATDTYGRTVARIRAAEGDLGVLLAREGLADDRYLEEFRHEHPSYAAELDAAFAEARAAGAGLWSTCWAAVPAEEPPDADDAGRSPAGPTGAGDGVSAAHGGRTGAWPCHPAYVECLPIGPDLDCRDVGHQVVLTGDDDPYRLDGRTAVATDGTGCDTFPPWSPTATYPYY